jgi:transposase-like protein
MRVKACPTCKSGATVSLVGDSLAARRTCRRCKRNWSITFRRVGQGVAEVAYCSPRPSGYLTYWRRIPA